MRVDEQFIIRRARAPSVSLSLSPCLSIYMSIYTSQSLSLSAVPNPSLRIPCRLLPPQHQVDLCGMGHLSSSTGTRRRRKERKSEERNVKNNTLRTCDNLMEPMVLVSRPLFNSAFFFSSSKSPVLTQSLVLRKWPAKSTYIAAKRCHHLRLRMVYMHGSLTQSAQTHMPAKL